MRNDLVAAVSAASGLLVGLLFPAVVGKKDSSDPATSPAITLITDAATRDRLGEGSLRLSDPRLSPRQLQQIGLELARLDPAAAVMHAKDVPGVENRDLYLGEVLRFWGETDGVAAASWVRSNFAGEHLSDLLYYVADGWAEAAPDEAADWFLENTSGAIRDDALWESVEAWGRKDTGAAVAWAGTLDDPLKWIVMDGLASGWASVNPAAAAAAGLEMLDEDHGHDFVITAVNHWADASPGAAADWIAGVSNARLRANACGELGKVWSQNDPSAALTWAATITDERSRVSALEGIAAGWSKHDPGGALEWALGSGENGAVLDEMITDITFHWSNLDPAGATRWLDTRPAGPGLDAVLPKFTRFFFEDDPAAAVGWATRIGEPALRETELRRLLKHWVDLRGDLARQEISELDLPSELKSEFVSQSAK